MTKEEEKQPDEVVCEKNNDNRLCEFCPVCGDVVWELRGKGMCQSCKTIVWTCCDGDG